MQERFTVTHLVMTRGELFFLLMFFRHKESVGAQFFPIENHAGVQAQGPSRDSRML